ncbi:MAG: ATP-binding cassette domain-containing protein [Clostridia bacterium]|nr:ATP-binding cassette domain-containing protein [Clostridia bacterium]
MEYVKDSRAYTFGSVLKNNIDRYFGGIKKNAAEEARFAKQSARYDALIKRGKTPEWHVVPKSLIDLDKAQADMLRAVDEMIAHYQAQIERQGERDYQKEAVALIDYLKENASGIVNKVTPGIAKERAIKLMDEVGIPDARKRYNQYPFEFSGGMRQRIVIAIALAANPDILICDEPTTALDVTIQAQILELIQNLKKQRNLSVIFITHDLGVVANMADRIAVMYAGKIVECGTAEEVFYAPAHPYTWALLSSMPDLDSKDKLEAIPGTPPDMIYPPVGDAFAERNRYAMQIDFEQQPPAFKITDTHWAATWLLHPDAPHVEPPKTVTERIAKMKRRMAEKEEAANV